ncbi:hypothetical protein AADEFJLK_04287 [Methylovulum psychrotolerans]|uniref:Transposase IS4-like domain-containing protein n=1 Tax=Methylovulum psychrotolerans TaxID=1704499 RepID=A0A2S5CGN2_9GAMM|nr:transposase [Methylovulum psychrotolerans]POZ49927.1 hypothetical protein AADEFJLK_04287 [Methylovulum psychrotolerans]
MNALYHSGDVSVPVAFEVVRKLHQFCDVKIRKVKRACVANAIKFRYVLTDSWFAAKENFEFILKKGKHFISALKDNCNGQQKPDTFLGNLAVKFPLKFQRRS